MGMFTYIYIININNIILKPIKFKEEIKINKKRNKDI